MSKTKNIYVCQGCGNITPKWTGQCGECGAWNSCVEEKNSPATNTPRGYAGVDVAEVCLLADIESQEETRIATTIQELDHVLGGGLVKGSVILIGGDPGIGKSTLLLQTLCELSRTHKALYVTGEESLQQVTLRARRLGLPEQHLQLFCETKVEAIIATAAQHHPQIMVIDSIQTIFSEELTSAPGTVSQVRESAARLVQFAKQTGVILFLVGHVTKEGTLAGPRVLEHMVDTVLYFEGDGNHRLRMIRAVKNRFGAVNELGVFAMTERGLKEVSNPSAIFLSRYKQDIAGSAIMVAWEGTRPLLVEVQALVDTSYLNNPRRVTVGLEQNRLAMLLAVLNRIGAIKTYDQDVFVNVVGGLRITETAADLALLLAVVSSLKNKALPTSLILFGEVGLAGEIRPVHNGQERLREAAKQGFKKAVVPKNNVTKQKFDSMEIIPVSRLQEVLELI